MELLAYQNLVFKVTDDGRVVDAAVLIVDAAIVKRVKREKHGTVSKYNNGRCRCWRCIAAQSAYKRERRARKP